MKNILVPTDFSEISKNALTFAVRIAQVQKSKIILFHSNQPVFMTTDMGGFVYSEPIEDEVEAEINEKMNELIEYTNRENVFSEKIIYRNVLKDAIGNAVEKEKIDLVVTGTHGAKGIEKFLSGTNSVDIFDHVKCPVLMIPAEARFAGINKIMYATDFQYGDVNEVKKVCELAAAFDAKVIITHINTNSQELQNEEEAFDWFTEITQEKIGYENVTYRLIHDKDLVSGIEKISDILDIDILCMSSAEKNFFERLMLKDHTKEMAYHTKIPLMAIHLPKKNKLS